jgi:hypothetical protein
VSGDRRSIGPTSEADTSVNSVSAEPKYKGRDVRPPCIGCGGGPDAHAGERQYLLCLEKAVRALRSNQALYKGSGLCTHHGCQRKAMVCTLHAAHK